jgi:NitT/TauT family transport system permease protein
MSRAALFRTALFVLFVGALEVLCRVGVIDKLTMQPPHRMVMDLWRILASGSLNAAIAKTLSNAATAFILAIVVGVASGVVLHRLKPVRETLDPLFATYYAIPIFAFYPLLIILFGLGDAPQILIGFMLGVVAVIVNTLNGLDRVPRTLMKTAQIARMGAIDTVLSISRLCRALHFDRRQARRRLFADRHHRRGVHHVAWRYGLRSASPTTTSTTPPCTR